MKMRAWEQIGRLASETFFMFLNENIRRIYGGGGMCHWSHINMNNALII